LRVSFKSSVSDLKIRDIDFLERRYRSVKRGALVLQFIFHKGSELLEVRAPLLALLTAITGEGSVDQIRSLVRKAGARGVFRLFNLFAEYSMIYGGGRVGPLNEIIETARVDCGPTSNDVPSKY
jgi:hypothetical protein